MLLIVLRHLEQPKCVWAIKWCNINNLTEPTFVSRLWEKVLFFRLSNSNTQIDRRILSVGCTNIKDDHTTQTLQTLINDEKY